MSSVAATGSPSTQHRIAQVTDRAVDDLLHAGGIASPRWWVSQRARMVLFVASIGCCVIGTGVYFWWYSLAKRVSAPSPSDLGTFAIFSVSSLFVYVQWADGRREQSLERYYDRLSLINDRYYEWPEARNLVGHFWRGANDQEAFRRTMYVYLEIDNIEYMTSRFELGFVSEDLFRRSVRAFTARCESVDFAKLAAQLVDHAGYREVTVRLVKRLASEPLA